MSVAASELEIELAERICERLPSIDLIRFTNSGTEAMLAAARGRAFTGREKVAVFATATTVTTTRRAIRRCRAGRIGIPAAVADTVVVAPFDDRRGHWRRSSRISAAASSSSPCWAPAASCPTPASRSSAT